MRKDALFYNETYLMKDKKAMNMDIVATVYVSGNKLNKKIKLMNTQIID